MAHILIIDDDKDLTDVFKSGLKHENISCTTVNEGGEAMELIKDSGDVFDVIVTDIQMPGVDGLDILKEATHHHGTKVIVMTGHSEAYNYGELIDLGASDFVYKPVTVKELALRIMRCLKERQLFSDLQTAYFDTIRRLATAAELRDQETGDHIIRVTKYCEILAKGINSSKDFIDILSYAAPMHDVGKIGVPDSILLKNGSLTNEEFDIMREHTLIGEKILVGSEAKVLSIAADIAVSHHEKWDGSGYPRGLKQNKIPMSGRITALADVFDVLTSPRPYKDAYPVEVAFEMIEQDSGSHFDPKLVHILKTKFDEVKKVRREIGVEPKTESYTLSERDKKEVDDGES